MEHFINLVRAKTGISEEQARDAVEVIMQRLKSKTPVVLHKELDKIADGGDFGDAFREKLEGMKGKFEKSAKDFGVKAEGFAEEMKTKFHEYFQQGK